MQRDVHAPVAQRRWQCLFLVLVACSWAPVFAADPGSGASTATPGQPFVGEVVEAKDRYGTWNKATVLQVDGNKRLVHWETWSGRWDAWVTPDQVRSPGTSAPPAAAPAAPEQGATPQALTYPTQLGAPAVGEVLHAQDDHGKWYKATVLKTDGDKRFVRFEGWEDRFNEWVTPDRVRPLTAEEAATASKPHVLDGWFAKTEIVYYGGGHLKCTYFWFRADGTCYAGDPPGGLLVDDFAALQRTDPKNCGTYRFVGSDLTITTPGGGTVSHTCSGVDGIMDRGGVLQRAFRFPDGPSLEGTYSASISSNFGGVHAVSGGTWTFGRDGGFTHNTFAGTETTEKRGTLGAAPGNGTGSTSALAKGRYQCAGGQLKLTDTSGQTETHAAFGIGKPNDYYLVVDGHLSNRQ